MYKVHHIIILQRCNNFKNLRNIILLLDHSLVMECSLDHCTSMQAIQVKTKLWFCSRLALHHHYVIVNVLEGILVAPCRHLRLFLLAIMRLLIKCLKSPDDS